MASPTLSLDYEGATGSNLFQYLTAVILSKLSQRPLLLPRFSRLDNLIDCLVGERVDSVDQAQVLVNEPFLWVLSRLYASQLATCWDITEGSIQAKAAQGKNFSEALAAIQTSASNLHLAGHFHNLNMGFFVQDAYKDIVLDAFSFKSCLDRETLDLLQKRSFVTLHIRRGDVVFYQFFEKGAHHIVATQSYLDSLESLWEHLDRPVLYIATNGDLDTYLSYFRKFNPICYRDLDLPQADRNAIGIDHAVMRQSRILFSSPGFFSLSAALFCENPDQEVFFFDLANMQFVKDDPRNQETYRRDPRFSPLSFFPWREKGLLKQFLLTTSRTVPAILRHRRNLGAILRQDRTLISPAEVVDRLSSRADRDELDDIEVSLLRLAQAKTGGEYRIIPRGKIDVFQ